MSRIKTRESMLPTWVRSLFGWMRKPPLATVRTTAAEPEPAAQPRREAGDGGGATIISLAARRERSTRAGRGTKKRRTGLSPADEKRIRDLAALLRRPLPHRASGD